MPLFEYLCSGGHVSERLLAEPEETLYCQCGRASVRIPSTFALLNPPTGAGLRNSFSLFQEATQEIDHHHTKAEATLEKPLPSPNLWKRAKHKAQAMVAAGEAPSPMRSG